MRADGIDSHPDDRRWMLQFLGWNIPTTFLFAVLVLALFALSPHLTFLISGVLTLVYGGLLLWSRRLALHGRLEPAAALIGGGLVVISVGSVLHAPSLWPMAVLLNVLAIVIALPYLAPHRSRGYFIGTWTFSIVLLAVAQWVRLIPESVPFLPVIQLTTVASVLGFVLFILWQYHARLAVLLAEVHTANAALRTAQVGLEAEVAARTGALVASEHRARASAVLYRALVQNLADTVVLMYDQKLRCLVAEGPLLERLGLNGAELADQSILAAWPVEHAASESTRLSGVFAGLNDRTEEQRAGRVLQTQYVPVRDVEGAITAGLVIIQDITQRKATEQALQDERDFAVHVMDAVGQGVLVADASGRYEYVNPAMARMLGYAREQIVGRMPFEFTFPEERERLLQSLADRRQGLAGSYEVRMRHADGSAVYGLVTGTPLLRDGRFAGTIVAVTDVTERKQIEAAVAFARDEALTASRLKSEFLATMSHELRTPLNGVLGMSDLLGATELSDEQRQYVSVIRSCGKSLLSLINDILDLSRIEAGKLELQLEPFDPRACIEAAASMVRDSAVEKGLSLQVQIDAAVPHALVGDAARIQQVLANLLNNAVKFTPHGSVQLRLSVQYADDGNGYELLCVVRDTGIGIPRERQGAIFEPFVQVDASNTRRYGGTGLGLAICRRLVTLMNGTIWVQSEAGQGAQFAFTVHCEQVATEEPPKDR